MRRTGVGAAINLRQASARGAGGGQTGLYLRVLLCLCVSLSVSVCVPTPVAVGVFVSQLSRYQPPIKWVIQDHHKATLPDSLFPLVSPSTAAATANSGADNSKPATASGDADEVWGVRLGP